MTSMEFRVKKTSEPQNEHEIAFETLDEFLAWVRDKGVGGVIVHYAKHMKWEGWELEIYDDYRE
jgi:hypothetical protein